MRSPYLVHHPFSIPAAWMLAPLLLLAIFAACKSMWFLFAFIFGLEVLVLVLFINHYGAYADLEGKTLVLRNYVWGAVRRIPLREISRIEIYLDHVYGQPVAMRIKCGTALKKKDWLLTAMALEKLPDFVRKLRANGVKVWHPTYAIGEHRYEGQAPLRKFCNQNVRKWSIIQQVLLGAGCLIFLATALLLAYASDRKVVIFVLLAVYLVWIGGIIYLYCSSHRYGGYPELEEDPERLVFCNVYYTDVFRTFRYRDIVRLRICRDRNEHLFARVVLRNDKKHHMISMGCLSPHLVDDFVADLQAKGVHVERRGEF